MTTRIQKAIKLDAVPEDKWPVMVQRTLLGLVIVAFGGVGAVRLEWPWYVVSGFVLVGSTVWSTQLVTNALKALVEPIRSFKALMGKDDA